MPCRGEPPRRMGAEGLGGGRRPRDWPRFCNCRWRHRWRIWIDAVWDSTAGQPPARCSGGGLAKLQAPLTERPLEACRRKSKRGFGEERESRPSPRDLAGIRKDCGTSAWRGLEVSSASRLPASPSRRSPSSVRPQMLQEWPPESRTSAYPRRLPRCPITMKNLHALCQVGILGVMGHPFGSLESRGARLSRRAGCVTSAKQIVLDCGFLQFAFPCCSGNPKGLEGERRNRARSTGDLLHRMQSVCVVCDT
jgi:hypothetical protein